MSNPRKSKAIATSTYAAIGCVVYLFTPPPSAEKPFFGVRVAAEQDGRFVKYSPLYHCKTESEGKALAEKIAKDRGIKVVVRAAPDRPVIHPPEKPEAEDDGAPAPF